MTYACSNLPPAKPGYYVASRKYFADGTYTLVMQFIEHRMSRLCRFDQRKNDERCGKCERESDVEYLMSHGLL